MEIYYQILLGSSLVLFLTMLGYVIRLRRRFVAELTTEKQQEINLRRELHDTTMQRDLQRTSVMFMQNLLDLHQDVILVFPINSQSEPGACTHYNQAALTLLEASSEQMASLQCRDIELVSEEEQASARIDLDRAQIGKGSKSQTSQSIADSRVRQQIKTILDGRTISRNTQIVTRQQHNCHVHMKISCVQKGNARFMVYLLHDIREWNDLQLQLDAALKNYHQLFQSSVVGVARYDNKKKLSRVNAAWLRIFGSPSIEEMQQLDIFAPPLISEQAKDQLIRGENITTEVAVDFDYLINKHGFVSSRRRKACLIFSYQNLGRDAYQHPIGHLVQVVDVTDLRSHQEALALREAQLQQARKMESIGMMTGGIAHDFNNILTPILGYSEIGVDLCAENETLREFIGEIHTATLRAKELVSQILIYSRQSDEDFSRIHLIPIIKEVYKQQAAVLAPKIEVHANIRTKDDLVLANPTQMHQVMTNLATNAAYAMRETGGTIDIQLTTFNLGWRHRQEFPELRKGTYIRLTVKDTGPGIPEQIRDKIFNPFFSTKPQGEGTGMGLAVVKGIIDSVGGAIALDTTPENGTTFHIALPLLETEPIESSNTWQTPLHSGKTVLFVDDEAAILKLASPMLESIGYLPIICNGGPRALEILQEQETKIDIMLTDQIMPLMNGLELARQTHDIRPELPIIICTGYPEMVDTDAALQAGVKAILVKPAPRIELSNVMDAVLKGKNLLKDSLENKPPQQPPGDDEAPNQDQ